MLLILAAILLIIAIAGGVIVHPLLFLLAIVAIVVFFTGRRAEPSADPAPQRSARLTEAERCGCDTRLSSSLPRGDDGAAPRVVSRAASTFGLRGD